VPLSVEKKSALKINATVQDQGRVEFNVPFASGVRITIFVVSDEDEIGTLDDSAERDVDAGRLTQFSDIEGYKQFLTQ
jgi:hypothetical protein